LKLDLTELQLRRVAFKKIAKKRNSSQDSPEKGTRIKCMTTVKL